MSHDNLSKKRNSKRQSFIYVLLWAMGVFLLDQKTKSWALLNLQHHPRFLTSWLHWRLAFNRGAAFSFLSDADGWQIKLFTSLGVIVTISLLLWLRKESQPTRWLLLGLGLGLGGIWGNIVDRLNLGFVIDFIELCWNHQPIWPTFNIADMGICIGFGFLVLSVYFQQRA